MISEQADCTIYEAILLMNERAHTQGHTVEQVAQDVVNHRFRFGPSN